MADLMPIICNRKLGQRGELGAGVQGWLIQEMTLLAPVTSRELGLSRSSGMRVTG